MVPDMNRFFVMCVACVAGLFTISQSIALSSVFDYYFYLLPFGMALVGLFLTAGMGRSSFLTSVSAGILQLLPVFGAFAMSMSVAVYLYAPWAGPSLFFLLLVIVQLVTYVSFWSVMGREEQLALSTAGVMIGLTLGYVFISYVNMDPLVVILMACIFVAALYIAHFLKKMQRVLYVLVFCLLAFAVYQVKQFHVMPASLGWVLDYGKAGPANTDTRNTGKTIWGPAGVSEIYALGTDRRAAWLYTNGSSPGLVLPEELASYDNAWWTQKAPLATAIYDAVRPRSIVDVGLVPSDMAWRAIGQGGQNVYGLYGSHDWSLASPPVSDLMRKSVVLLQQPTLSAEERIKLPVDMIVLSSGHEGKKEGWVSSNAGEQTFLNQENILSYWDGLGDDGVLVLLSRQQSVFLRQFFSVWAALNNTGMSDAEFLDRAWGLAPVNAEATDSPYYYAAVITKKAKDEKFARALRTQVLKLPVRYLFGYGLPPSPPYHVFYQHDMSKVHAIFTQAISGMFAKNMSLEASNTDKAIPYQFVADVFPQYKNMLVLSVGMMIWIILFPLQEFRRVEYTHTLRGPSAAVWMVAGGATGALMVIALAYLIVYPSSVAQEFRLLYLVILLLIASLAHVSKARITIARQTMLLLAFVSALVLTTYLASSFLKITADEGKSYVGVAGIMFVLLGMSLPVMQSSLLRDSEVASVSWWWFAMAAGSAAALFWSMRLYSALGDGLFLIAGLLLMGIAGVFWWHGRSHTGDIREPGVAEANPVL